MTQYTKQLKISVGGMTCNHCKMNVEKSLKSLAGIESVEANQDTGNVVIKGNDFDMEMIRQAVESIGYDYNGVRD